MKSNTNSLDGLALWFFGGTPGPDDLDSGCTLTDSFTASIDEDDSRIPAFAHRCDCGRHNMAACGQKKHTLPMPLLA
ncbi:MAG: hypothetical protein Q7V20_01440 [Aquabacterium sp.]|uniref:hypothetical protein n=1 Tax=Aquabacterium sp. TaxID=1872578 RepID=UPI00271E1F51|nr:hypothetical protein [Aquabacterium sp.]MDO9002096.1 hypothetical protein [Aquabacterium sp.]